MSLKAHFKDDSSEQIESIGKKILNSFIMAGLKFVRDSREQVQDHAAGTYEDQTANLRNSIGFAVFHNGEMVYSDIGPKVEDLESIMNSVKPSGFQLIGFAGMNYASYVESKGYNVISYQADVCMVDISVYLEHLEIIEEGSAARAEDSFLPDDLPESFFNRE